MSEVYDATKQITALKALPAYRFLTESEIPEIRAVGVTMEHVKTGARVFLLLSDDPNKVFTIGFRKYPSKDPFVELVKGSLNTFLNAMTYPDKTIYPVASCNEADFRNLMDVYLDAVFHPNLYREEKIFRQEGWHYEMESADGPLTLNGVVYNEMKGVYSSADGILERAVDEALFPGHPYAEESGGDPAVIPELTYGDYLDFHTRYYHPSNSFIYLYGNTDMAEHLAYIDREYLSGYDRRPVDSEIRLPEPLSAPVEKVVEYSISESESEDDAACLSLNIRVGGELDPLMYNAFQALGYVLLEVPGAPLHKALIEAGIGEDADGGYNYGIREPYFSVNARNTSPDRKDDFLRVVQETLEHLADGGLDHDMVKAAVNVAEFRAREADFGAYPKGLMYGIESFNSWLYDEENPQRALVILKPVSGLTARKDEALKEKLAAAAAAMTREERERIAAETKALKDYQNEPSRPEDLRKIPLLKRTDIAREAEKIIFEEREEDGIPVIWSEVFTSGIAYLKLIFDCSTLSSEELSCLALLRDTIGYIDTESRDYAALSTLINLNSGGIGTGVDSYPDFHVPGKVTLTANINAKVLYGKIGFALETMREMLLTSKLSDTARLREIVAEMKSGLRDRLTSGGHVAALNRAGSFLSEGAAFSDATRGIRYYRLLERLSADFDAEAEKLSGTLADLVRRLFTADNMRIHLVCDAAGYDAFRAAVRGYRKTWPETAVREDRRDFTPGIRREAWESASLVNYVARCGNFRDHGFEYTGVLRILKLLLSYDYLWKNIRVLGGAYGCSATFGRSGIAGFTSYRDPKLLETDAVYDGIADWAENFETDEREMTKAIIGTFSDLDVPLTPLTKGLRGLSAWYSHVTDEDLQRERDQILAAEPEDIRALAPLLRAALSDGAKCAIGNETQIRAAAEAFTDVQPLFRE